MTLGLSDEEFENYTPRQYHLLLERHMERQKHAEWLTGVISSAVANWSMRDPKEPVQPGDFPLPLIQQTRPSPPRVRRQRVADQCRSLFRAAIKAQQHA